MGVKCADLPKNYARSSVFQNVCSATEKALHSIARHLNTNQTRRVRLSFLPKIFYECVPGTFEIYQLVLERLWATAFSLHEMHDFNPCSVIKQCADWHRKAGGSDTVDAKLELRSIGLGGTARVCDGVCADSSGESELHDLQE